MNIYVEHWDDWYNWLDREDWDYWDDGDDWDRHEKSSNPSAVAFQGNENFRKLKGKNFTIFKVFCHLKWLLNGSNVHFMYDMTYMTQISLLFQL